MQFSAATLLLLVPLLPAAMAEWTLSDIRCQDNDCAAKLNKNQFSFHFDNGRGFKTDCLIKAPSPFAIPDDFVDCDDKKVRVKFSQGKKWGGCQGFKAQITFKSGDTNQGKEFGVGGGDDKKWDCKTNRPMCPPGSSVCMVCGGKECKGKDDYKITMEPDNDPKF